MFPLRIFFSSIKYIEWDHLSVFVISQAWHSYQISDRRSWAVWSICTLYWQTVHWKCKIQKVTATNSHTHTRCTNSLLYTEQHTHIILHTHEMHMSAHTHTMLQYYNTVGCSGYMSHNTYDSSAGKQRKAEPTADWVDCFFPEKPQITHKM